MNTVMYYGPEIIIQSGITIDGVEEKEQAGIIMQIPLAFTNAIGSTIAIFIIDGLGRRYIILRTLPGVFFSLVAIAYSIGLCVFSEEEKDKTSGRILLYITIITYLLSYSIGFSSTPWAVNSEIYPIHLIGTANGITTATNWLSTFAVSSVFLTCMETDIGKVVTFLVLAIISLCAFIFVFLLLPETAGKKITENIKQILGDDAYLST